MTGSSGAGGWAAAGLPAHRVRLPLRVPLGGRSHREATLVEGPLGWGEFSPLPGYPSDPRRSEEAVREAVSAGWPAPVRREVPVNGLIPAVDAASAAELATEARAAGMTTVKVKVGGGPLDPATARAVAGAAPAGMVTVTVGGDPLAADADRVAAVRAALGPSGSIRLDANGAWDVDTAVAAIRRLAGYDLELVEQPVADLGDLAEVRRRVDVPVAADESIRSLDDARRLAALDAADAIVVKVQPLGGVQAALRVIEAAGVPAIVSSLYETSVGLAAGVALAAALPDLPFACGLGTAALFEADVVAEPLLPERGVVAVRRPAPDPALLARWAVEE